MTTITTTTAGRVEGREKGGALLFAGIPYAAPPTGERRFRPPAPHEGWSGVRDARRFGPLSWQIPGLLGGFVGDPSAKPDCQEDCLTLNVCTPAIDDAHRPVMFWIHGGGFTSGTGAVPWYNGAPFAGHGDVVVVSINYRLGALGFLQVGDLADDSYASSGLNGILDQVAALEWVRDNIASFGGDPGNVTIFGESAGAMSVGTLLGLPRAAGLFHRAVAQSGAAANIATPEQAAEVTKVLLEELGATSFEQLLAADPADIVAIQQRLPAILRKRRLGAGATTDAGTPLSLGLPFSPVLDGIELPVAPQDAVAAGSSAGVPLLVGTNADEWNLFHLMTRGRIADDTAIRSRVAKVLGGGDEIVDTYRANRPDASPDDLWCAILTDVVFRVPAIRLAEAQAAHQPDHTFMYLFTWSSTAFDGAVGSSHALEIPFVFDTLDSAGARVFLGDGPVPSGLARSMHDAWWHFARNGDPSHDGLPAWPAYGPDTRTTMELGDLTRTVDDPAADERLIWNGVI